MFRTHVGGALGNSAALRRMGFESELPVSAGFSSQHMTPGWVVAEGGRIVTRCESLMLRDVFAHRVTQGVIAQGSRELGLTNAELATPVGGLRQRHVETGGKARHSRRLHRPLDGSTYMPREPIPYDP